MSLIPPMIHRLLLGILVAGLLPLTLGAEPLRVAATTSLVADLVRQVAGPEAEVTSLMGPGVDPHLYKPTTQDVRTLDQAQVIFYNGLHLEGRMTDLLVRMARRGLPVYPIAESIPEDRLLSPPDYEGAHDPHIWFDPELWALAVDTVVRGLSEANPAQAEFYAERGQAVQAELRALRAWAQERIARLPEARRILITSHDAYNYFGRAFGFTVLGVQGISTVTEAGLADMTALADLIRQREVPAIFVETSVSPRTIQRLRDETGVRIGGELFSDALGEPGRLEEAAGERYDVGTYAGMFRHNVNTLVEALANPE